MDAEDFAKAPLFFAPNRVWRCYLGGALMGEFITGRRTKDGYFPEDWLASVTLALNGPNSQGPEEGLSRVLVPGAAEGPTLASLLEGAPEAFLGPAHVAAYGPTTALLAKFLDSAIRLPVQSHPDRDFARQHYHSEFGKTESWLILAGREIDGEPPYLLLGFKPDVDPDRFKQAALGEDSDALVSMMHKVPVHSGEVYLIPGRFPHAIGAGVLMVEVQEPTDWVVQPERWVGDVRLDDAMMWGPLDPEVALECFDYTGLPLDETLALVRCEPTLIEETEGYELKEAIGPQHTDCFGVQLLTVDARCEFQANAAFWLGIVTLGGGELAWEGGVRVVQRGSVFLVPAAVPSLRLTPMHDSDLEITVCLPPRV